MTDEIKVGLVYCFIHGHAKRIADLLEISGTTTAEYGSNLDGLTEPELMGHLNMLALYAEQLDKYYKSMTVKDKQ